MTRTGTFRNGVVHLDDKSGLHEGQTVRIIVIGERSTTESTADEEWDTLAVEVQSLRDAELNEVARADDDRDIAG